MGRKGAASLAPPFFRPLLRDKRAPKIDTPEPHNEDRSRLSGGGQIRQPSGLWGKTGESDGALGRVAENTGTARDDRFTHDYASVQHRLVESDLDPSEQRVNGVYQSSSPDRLERVNVAEVAALSGEEFRHDVK